MPTKWECPRFFTAFGLLLDTYEINSAVPGSMMGFVGTGLSPIQLSDSAYHSLYISQRNDRNVLLPRLYLEKGHRSLPIPISQSVKDMACSLAGSFPLPPPHPPFMAVLGLLGEGHRMRENTEVFSDLLPSNSPLFSEPRAFQLI